MDTEVHQLVYSSVYNYGRVDNSLRSLVEILKISRRNNAASAVTGYLIFDGTRFLQILEGEPDSVRRTYARIEADARHRDLIVISERMAPRRLFGEWAMAGYLRGPEQQAIFARYGLTGPIDPATLKADVILALAQDLAASQPATVPEQPS